MIHFTYLNKAQKDLWLPKLFDLLHENMRVISPFGSPYEQERRQWLAAVSPALDKEPRQIILCFSNDELAGYLQYYTRGDLLMIEEVQLKKEYQRTFLFFRLCRHLSKNIPPEVSFIEAYADKRNHYSQRIMQKLGMEVIEEAADSPFVHLRGSMNIAKKYFPPKTRQFTH